MKSPELARQEVLVRPGSPLCTDQAANWGVPALLFVTHRKASCLESGWHRGHMEAWHPWALSLGLVQAQVPCCPCPTD